MNKNHLHFITYGDGNFSHIEASLRLLEQAKATGWFNDAHAFNLDLIAELDPTWYSAHKKFISENPRGNGYWIWKPKIIQLMLDLIPENDVLLYLDGGSELNTLGEKRFSQYVDLASNFNLLAFIADEPSYYKLGECTKKQCLDYFNISLKQKEVLELNQIEAGCLFIRNCETSRKFVREWLAIAEEDDYIYLNDFLGDSQLPQFKDHRHDQSIFYMLMLRDKDFGIVIGNENYFPSNWAQGAHPKGYPIGLMRNISKDSRLSKMIFLEHQIGDPIVFNRHSFSLNPLESADSYAHKIVDQESIRCILLEPSIVKINELYKAIERSTPAFSSRQMDMVLQHTVRDEKSSSDITFNQPLFWLRFLRRYLILIEKLIK